jgi:hypothetical protein
MRLLPHDDKFFDLLVDHARIAAQASQVFADALNGPEGTRGETASPGRFALSNYRAIKHFGRSTADCTKHLSRR